MMKRLRLCALIVATLTGCSPFPALDIPARTVTPALDYPAILPLDDLLAQAGVTDTTAQTGLAARAAALQARAAALRTAP